MNSKTTDFDSIFLKLASPEDILSWSHGEVTKAETINYRTQRPEREGLFDERIFGPEKDYECYCGKYRRIRYKGIVCEKCGVEITRSIVRRERMGHISLAAPVIHIWFLKGVPSQLGLVLDISVSNLEKIIYFAGYIITKVDNEAKKEVQKALEKEYNLKKKKLTSQKEKADFKNMFTVAKTALEEIKLHSVLQEAEYRYLSMKFAEVFEAGSGAETLHNICSQIDLGELIKKYENVYEKATPPNKKKIIRQIALASTMKKHNIRPEWMFLTQIPVIPPALRPMVQLDGGRHATSDSNDLYRRVLNRNNRLKKLLELNAPEVIVKNEKRMLQESVDALLDNSVRRSQGAALSQSQKRPLRSLADMLRGKQGRFRQNLLGKRVDYSGRSVIVVGPELKLHQCGLPKLMALELFRPFVISKIIKKELAHNIRGANRLIDEKTDDVWEILENVIKDKYVLLNRAPTLHRLGIQAFKPILIDGNAIQIHPLVCGAFNADFDGDQMAVHIPLSNEAQEEAATLMVSTKNLLIPRTGNPVVHPSQDIVLGCFFMTRARPGAKGEGGYFSCINEAVRAYDFGFLDLQALIKVRLNGSLIETTTGRLLFNTVLPDDFGFLNEEINKKRLAKIVEELIERYGTEATPEVLDKIKSFGYLYATKSGFSWGMNDLREPKEKGVIIKEAEKEEKEVLQHYNEGLLTDEERYSKSISIWNEAKEKVDELVPSSLEPFGSVYSMISSSARGSWGQANQMASMKGLVVNPAGRIIDFPIKSSYKNGLNVLEYFISTHGSRKGVADTALKTSKAGYLTRRLVDVAQDVIISEEDCKDKDGFLVKRPTATDLEEGIVSKLAGRELARSVNAGSVVFKSGHFLSQEDAKIINDSDAKEIYVRSPLTCLTGWGICRKCYGRDLGRNGLIKLGETVGVIAAQAIGEPGTQLTMRTFHTGGVATRGGDITLGLPRVEELFEMRIPRDPAVISEVDGVVVEIKEEEFEKIVTVLSETGKDSLKYTVPFGKRVMIKLNQKIKTGDSLSDGPIDVKSLFKVAGKEVAQRYILKEVALIYKTQGVPIDNKHLEIIVRQMFSRYRVMSPGETELIKGRVVERTLLLSENKKAKKENKKEAETIQLLMGISKVSLSTSSFLSAASFQDTARVLMKAATAGARDYLTGLKENVIIGHLIPAGTSFRKDLKSIKGSKIESEEKE